MFINFWYPICMTDELGAAPLRVELLGLRFVAFRDGAGRARVLADTCVHRGGSLSRGKLRDGCVECPYHGWRFDGDGRCVKIASLPDQAPPARAKVDSYPVEEHYGVVFAFLGDLPEAERPPVCPVPEYGQPGWRASRIMLLDVRCWYERSMENGLDPVHNEFVHPGQGFPPMLMDTFRIDERDWGSGFEAYFGNPKLEMTTFARERNRTGELRAGSWFHGPNNLITSIFINADSNLVQYFFEAPVDANRTRIYFLNMRNCMLEESMDEKVMQVNLKITREDIGILEELWPVRTPDSTTRELLTPSDRVVMRYRERLQEWESRGWRIDRKAIAASAGDVAWAIPGPARRESGNWVIEAVPTVAGG
ncbi:MAG: aromatic ring-hydroxylating dioxygenase subunit alpha [Gammaproteobacteria bacterium]|nr:aromatic ring-hydroxylating dioxygenase subunit alpha [Gammaproteobacteria bacterium]